MNAYSPGLVPRFVYSSVLSALAPANLLCPASYADHDAPITSDTLSCFLSQAELQRPALIQKRDRIDPITAAIR
jgi:hypothetical protein